MLHLLNIIVLAIVSIIILKQKDAACPFQYIYICPCFQRNTKIISSIDILLRKWIPEHSCPLHLTNRLSKPCLIVSLLRILNLVSVLRTYWSCWTITPSNSYQIPNNFFKYWKVCNETLTRAPENWPMINFFLFWVKKSTYKTVLL